MSRCHRTDALLEAALAGAVLTPREADHVTGCAECARAAALARRFESELYAVGAELVPEPASASQVASDAPVLHRGGSIMRRGAAIAATGAFVLAIAFVGFRSWPDSWPNLGDGLEAVEPGTLDAWLDGALRTAHAESNRGSVELDDWEAVQVEQCGRTLIAFFADHHGEGSAYLWAIGATGVLADPSLDTGSAGRLSDVEVATRRATLPVCEFVLGGDPAVTLPNAAALPGQGVVRIPGFAWAGDLSDAPIEVETIGPAPEGMHGAVLLRASLVGRVEPSVRAVDLLTPDGRLRYTVHAPGFAIDDAHAVQATAYELIDGSGRVVASGPVLDSPDERRAAEAAARAAGLAAAERRALEAGEGVIGCSDWPALALAEQLAITEVLVADLERARVVENLRLGASRAEIIAGARESLSEGCLASPGDRTVADVARTLFGGE